MATKISTKQIETLTHDEARRKNIPPAEQQSFVQQDQTAPKQIRYPVEKARGSNKKYSEL